MKVSDRVRLDDAGRTLTIKWYKCCFTERIYLSWNLSGFVWSSRNIQKSKDTSMTECLLLKGHWGTQTNTPPRPNINKLFCDRSSYFDLWLLLIILWTLRSKSMLYATQGSCPDRTQPYIPHTDRGLWVQPGTCGISLSNKHTLTQIQHFYKAHFRVFGLCTTCHSYGPLLLSWPTGQSGAVCTAQM